MRKALFAASLALVAATTVGCGGGDGGGSADAPDNATKEEFCGAFQDFFDEVGALEQGETEKQIEALKDFGDTLDELGTPEGTPEDAQAGFELTVQAIQDLPDDATQEDLQAVEEGFSEEEQKQSDAFDEYLTDTCPGPEEAP